MSNISKEREAAYRALLRIEKDNAFSNLAINDEIKKAGELNQGFTRELVYGVLERKKYIDWILGHFLRKGTKSLKADVLTLLRMGIYQIEYMDSVPEYAAVNETVNMAGRLIKGRKPLVNGVLRNYLRKREDIKGPDPSESDYYELIYSVDSSVVRLFEKERGKEQMENYLKFINTPPEIYIRVNLLKTDTESLIKKLELKGISSEPITNSLLKVKGSGLAETEEFALGHFSIQSDVSYLAAMKTEAKPGETVIDMCAAPGGKTFAVAELMENKGTVYSFDIYDSKIKLIKKQAKRLSISCVKAEKRDGTVFYPEFKEMADRVIADVPCSGLGMARRKPEIKYKDISAIVNELTDVQAKILDNAAEYLKPEGRLVYSTCTLTEAENQNQVREFLKRHKEYRLVEETEYTPEKGYDGFFAAVFEKLKGEADR